MSALTLLARPVGVGVAVGVIGAMLALPRLELAWAPWMLRALLRNCRANYAPVEVVLLGILLCAIAVAVGARLGGRTASARVASAVLALALTLAATLAIDMTFAMSMDIGTGRGGAPYGLVEACP
jgi:hypothetical protein